MSFQRIELRSFCLVLCRNLATATKIHPVAENSQVKNRQGSRKTASRFYEIPSFSAFSLHFPRISHKPNRPRNSPARHERMTLLFCFEKFMDFDYRKVKTHRFVPTDPFLHVSPIWQFPHELKIF